MENNTAVFHNNNYNNNNYAINLQTLAYKLNNFVHILKLFYENLKTRQLNKIFMNRL
jgi:hypothetical protein